MGYGSGQYVYTVETGRAGCPSPRVLQRLCKAYHLDMKVIERAAVKDFRQKFKAVR